MNQFKQYDLSPEILKALDKLNYIKPTGVQKEIIPIIQNEEDVLCRSQTGSGKTAAFGIPIIEQLDWDENSPQMLVLTPTRELAIQVHEDLFNIGRFKRIKASVLYGKSPIKRQERELKQKTHVVVGTPGRVMDHIVRGNLKTDCIKFLVIDEADEMLNMGFIDQVEEIIDEMPKNRVTMLFSATFEPAIQKLSQEYLKNPTIVEVEDEFMATGGIDQWMIEVDPRARMETLKDIMIAENPDSAMLFCNTQEQVNSIVEFLGRGNRAYRKIHGGMEQDERTLVMHAFKKGDFRYLVATDVAARGIDVDSVELIVNCEVPWEKETYTHRIGRTGRQGKEGKAITLYSSREEFRLGEIQNFSEQTISSYEWPEDFEEMKVAYVEKIEKKPKAIKGKADDLIKDITKIHVNAGKKTKLRPVDVVGTLCNIPGMTAEDIGVISILDISAFVEILNGKGEMVLEALQTKPIKGRLRKVSLASDKPIVARRKIKHFNR